MSRRLNIVLPEATVQTIDRMVKPGERSRFINQAVQHYVANRSAEALRARLESIDREVAADWFRVDQKQWQQLDKPTRKPATPSAAKSTSRRSTRP
jgi:CopG family transcriptional regulator/antitoxin EndoAI